MPFNEPCNNYVEDPAICDDFGQPKGQCANCGFGDDEHHPNDGGADLREQALTLMRAVSELSPPPPEHQDWLNTILAQFADDPVEPTTIQGMTDNMTDQQQPTPTPEPAPTELTIGNMNLLFHGDGVELRVAELAHKFTYAEAQKLHGALGAMLIRTDTPENVKRRLNGRVRCPNCAGRSWVLSGGNHIERCDGCKYYRDDYSAALAFLANTPKGRPGAADYEEEAASYGVDRGDQITEDDE